MTIIHISDTHGRHKELDFDKLPKAEVIVHSGDFTFAGSDTEAYDFMNWFCDLSAPHKIFIAGNHDMCMYGAHKIDGLPDNVHYLSNSGVVIDGIRFFGIPMFMEDVMDGTMDKLIDDVPIDTNVLISHEPPYGVKGDLWKGRHCGNKRLREKISELPALQCHLFGHQHDAAGVEQLENTDVVLSNAALVDSQYNQMFLPNIITI